MRTPSVPDRLSQGFMSSSSEATEVKLSSAPYRRFWKRLTGKDRGLCRWRQHLNNPDKKGELIYTGGFYGELHFQVPRQTAPRPYHELKSTEYQPRVYFEIVAGVEKIPNKENKAHQRWGYS